METDSALKQRLKKKRVRVCKSMHECCLCGQKISYGQAYFDGGYAKRAHAKCADPDGWGADAGKCLMDIPKDKSYPLDAVQCDDCGGNGCATCEDKGWLPAGHTKGRHCLRPGCNNPIPPSQVAIYCCNQCAFGALFCALKSLT